MKKIFYCLVILLSLFIFSDNAEAVVTDENGNQYCYYQLKNIGGYKDIGLQFMIHMGSGNGVVNPYSPGAGSYFSFPALSSFDGGETLDPTSANTIKFSETIRVDGVQTFISGTTYSIGFEKHTLVNGKCPKLYLSVTATAVIYVVDDVTNIPLTEVDEVEDTNDYEIDDDVDVGDNGFIDDGELVGPEVLVECDRYDYLLEDALHGALKMKTRLIKEYGSENLQYQIKFYVPAEDDNKNYETGWQRMYATGDGDYPYFHPTYGDYFKINYNAIDVLKSDLDTKSCSSTVYTNKINDRGYEISTVSNGTSSIDNFDALIGAMYNPMNALDSKILDYKLLSKYGKEGFSLRDFEANNDVCSYDECKNNVMGNVETSLRKVKKFCNNLYNHADIENLRVKDCINFEKFYKQLVVDGYINDLTSGCDFVTDDLRDKLIWVLDLIKIAGPILALGLGTLDFIKVLAAGDADKEMKNAFKRFSIRILTAILLFIIPVLIAFLLDVFIGNQDGYNSDNPFCDIVEWEE